MGPVLGPKSKTTQSDPNKFLHDPSATLNCVEFCLSRLTDSADTMNPPPPPPPPSPSPHSFTFFPQNPDSNMSNIVPPNPNLITTLSALKTLIHQSETVLTSSQNLLHQHCSAALSPCPFDPRHRMPPEFLFRHHLRCPSSHFPPLDPSILQSLRYPNTLQSKTPNSFKQHLSDPNSELCISLDQLGDIGSNFFYRDCPGVVQLDRPLRTLTLPGLLSVECADLVGAGDDERIGGVSGECVRLLPSEVWEVRREIGMWSDFPSSYSYAVLSVVLSVEMVKMGDFLKWLIANSPRYGLVIDVATTDHIFVLFRFVLKAILREAVLGVKGKGLKMKSKTMNLECPNLIQAMMWLASQLRILYGQANGKLFAINMLKQCLFTVASGLMLFASEENMDESPGVKQVAGNVDVDVNGIKNAKVEPPKMGTEYDERAIFLSQVAAAVAALHERSLLEEKIKSLRLMPLPRYQLVAEHAYLTARADEERKNNPNYKPIPEHDGFLWQRSHNQESNKTRTREELLAEERDYKRRRMSYRGKKLKQTTTQVMRDIIAEYMEEIKQAEGIGCAVKGADKGNVSPSKLLSTRDSSTDNDELEKILHTSSESRGGSQDFRKRLPFDYKVGSTRFDDSHWYDGNLEYHKKSFSSDKHDREYNSRSSERSRSQERSHEQTSHRSERGDVEGTRFKKHELSSSMSKYRDSRAFSSASKRVNDSTMQRSETKDRWQRKAYQNHFSESTSQNLLDDRYNPSASDDDILENDISTQSKSVKP